MERTELLIIGAGAAGISAACAAWDAGCRNIVLADRLPCAGGILFYPNAFTKASGFLPLEWS